ncbi:hypothetical protein EJB05_23982, partial [Eragrostis curvula]
MSVLIVTSVGDIEVDLHTSQCPLTTKNFLKLCKIKYYNGCLFHAVHKDFVAQTGDPTGTGAGGDSVYKFLYGDQARFFDDEIRPELRHSKAGTVAMASAGKGLNASQFYITLRDGVDYLDGEHTVFGVVAEGFDTLAKINEAYVDEKGRPFKDIRIKHTYVLDDPFDDPPQLADLIPEKSPTGKPLDEVAEERLQDSWAPLDETMAPEDLEEMVQAREARTNAAILQGWGTFQMLTSNRLKTSYSLCYAFIEFETKEACVRAFKTMGNCLIDDRRIQVDFSQSVSKMWRQFRQSKISANRDGCQDGDRKNKGPSYVLRDVNTQHGEDHRRSYDLVFEKDGADCPDEKDHENGQRKKIQRVDDRRSEVLPQGGSNKSRRERTQSADKGIRRDRTQDRSTNRADDEYYRRRDKSDGVWHHRDDGHKKSERHRRDEVRQRKRNPECRDGRENGGHRDRHQHSDDSSHKERRHIDGR